jgi:hypothetical protein
VLLCGPAVRTANFTTKVLYTCVQTVPHSTFTMSKLTKHTSISDDIYRQNHESVKGTKIRSASTGVTLVAGSMIGVPFLRLICLTRA